VTGKEKILWIVKLIVVLLFASNPPDVIIPADLPDLICFIPIDANFLLLFFVVLVVVFCLDTSTGVGFDE